MAGRILSRSASLVIDLGGGDMPMPEEVLNLSDFDISVQ